MDDENMMDDEEEELCASCNGTGEGQYDGASCRSCRGSGIAIDREAEREAAAEAAADRWYEREERRCYGY